MLRDLSRIPQKRKPAPLLRVLPSVWLTPLFLTNEPELDFANPRPTPNMSLLRPRPDT